LIKYKIYVNNIFQYAKQLSSKETIFMSILEKGWIFQIK